MNSAQQIADLNRRLIAAVEAGDRDEVASIAREYAGIEPSKAHDARSDYQRALDEVVEKPPNFVGAKLVCGVCDAVVGQMLISKSLVLLVTEWADPVIQNDVAVARGDPLPPNGRWPHATSADRVLLAPVYPDRDPERSAVARCADHGWLRIDETGALAAARLGFNRQRCVRLPLGTL